MTASLHENAVQLISEWRHHALVI